VRRSARVRQALGVDQHEDPVLRRRTQVLRLTSLGQRFGYACFAMAMVLFFVGLVAQFPQWTVTTIVVLIVGGSVVLLPSIIFSYAAKAADKEDRGEPFGY
jgi:hypothetical protein